jgi:hypothetical protein
MAGCSSITGLESIIFADNASFDGTEREGALSADGELWIGSSTSPHVVKGVITNSDGSISVVNGRGTIDVKLSPRFSSVNVVSSAYSLSSQDNIVIASSGTFSITLPSAVSLTGRVFVVQNSGSGTITLNTTSSQVISGSLTQTLAQWESFYVASNGSDWVIV